jgi:hypothetical protein
MNLMPRHHRPLRTCGRLALLFLALYAVPSHAQEPPREGPWIVNDLPAAWQEARRTGKPIFAVFRCER